MKGTWVVEEGSDIASAGGVRAEYGREADGPVDVRTAVREQIAAGASIIKLMATGGISTPGNPGSPGLTAEEMSAAVGEAHRRGAPGAAQAHPTQGIIPALHPAVHTL